MPKLNPIQRALAKFDGSPTKMARALGDKVLRQHVEHWLKSERVPPEHCLLVRDLTGVQLWDLRPDDWFRIWPIEIGSKGAPAVPRDEPKARDGERATASSKPAKRDHKPSNRKGD